ncbi:MFS transporter [Goodfellowiella coeruleoviolacea]|uniref:Arabinose efflux permease, MFS family n=1 Tax=Goodfellowiella coeruleoviolacea TaxID=334858 RepID=A0AAE3G9S7_9PSEU|nr:MFS transporter [Goodfellowiella coeruleoviolacea]MCP2163509.1 putative arabinose efflux permease, MFS family [Goodfellowiella coeruleoviolacea]
MRTAVALSAWAPLRRPTFRALWIAQFGANTGTWVQTVGAQWLMGDLGGRALQIALVQTAMTLPVFLLVVPAGALGDIVDRRRLLLCGQTAMFVGSGALAVLTAERVTTPALLLGLTALMGIGDALCVPSFQAIQPELVSRAEIPQAALLNGANANVARAVGPALGGALIALIGPAVTFAFNTLSFLGVLLVLYQWRRPTDHHPLGPEHVLGATRAGARYIRSAPRFAAVLARSMLFMLFASGLWALLPALARGPLALAADAYGLLLASVGAGAVVGIVVVPRLRDQLGSATLSTAGMVVFAGAMFVIGVVESVPAVVTALVVVGLAWIGVQSTLNAVAQILLPAWTRARALAYYQLVFMGGQALGAVGWGVLADAAGLRTAFVAPALGMLVGALVSVRALPLPKVRPDLKTVHYWPEPTGRSRLSSGAGPVLIIVEWRVDEANASLFVAAMQHLERSRRRTGATLWGLFQDTEEPTLFVETFIVATWHEHLRQHVERATALDRELEEIARKLTIDGQPAQVRHAVWAESVIRVRSNPR